MTLDDRPLTIYAITDGIAQQDSPVPETLTWLFLLLHD
jgi:hypothetical protein